jgi:hypothetical protein
LAHRGANGDPHRCAIHDTDGFAYTNSYCIPNGSTIRSTVG